MLLSRMILLASFQKSCARLRGLLDSCPPFYVPGMRAALLLHDEARLEYGRMLWKLPHVRERRLRPWLDPRHPYSDRFSEKMPSARRAASPITRDADEEAGW